MNRRLSLAIVVSAFATSCFTMKPVEYKRTENFSVTSNNNSPILNFGLVFHNPNAFGCTISNVESEGTLNNRLVFNAGVATKIRARKKSDFTFPVSAVLAKMDMGQLLGSGINLLLNDEAIPLKVKGKITVRKFIFSKTYEFDYTQSLDKALLKKLF